MRGLLVVMSVLAPIAARADDTELNRATVVFARAGALFKTDGKGKAETQLAPLPAAPAGTTNTNQVVRALRTDARGTVLLADISNKWFWMPLDGTKPLVELPCADGPAQLAVDGACVLCRSKQTSTGSVIVNLASGRATAVAIPTAGARLAGTGADRRLVWADAGGIWTAPAGDLKKRTKVAPEAPLRGLLPSPDGKHAVGVYADFMYEGSRTKKPADILMSFNLDGDGGRRKGIRNGVPLEWSHDNRWVLVQDGSKACVMLAVGGQYKCWKGFTAVSLAPDGSYALLLGNRNATAAKTPPPAKAPAKGAPPTDDDAHADAADDVPVPPPTGPLALYRAKMDGMYDVAPEVVTRIVDGAAAWIPGK